MVILEIGRYMLSGASAVGGLLILDRIAMAWPRLDWSDRIIMAFLLLSIAWACAYTANQAIHGYVGSKTEVLALITALAVWCTLGRIAVERRQAKSEDSD